MLGLLKVNAHALCIVFNVGVESPPVSITKPVIVVNVDLVVVNKRVLQLVVGSVFAQVDEAKSVQKVN